MHSWLREAAEKLEQHCPGLWAGCYPHRILAPAGYANPKLNGVVVAGHLKMLEGLRPDAPPAHTMVSLTALGLIRFRMPTYFVEEEFADAAAHIRLPEGLSFGDIRWPLEAMLLVLPEAWSRRHFGWHVPFMSLCRLRKGNHPNPGDSAVLGALGIDSRGIWPCHSDSDRFLMSSSLLYDDDSGNVPPVDYTGDYPMDKLLSVVKEAPFNDATVYERELFGAPEVAAAKAPNEEEDLKLSHALTEFAVKILLAITARPTVVRAGTLARAAKCKKGRTRDELWNPSMVGAGYRVARPATDRNSTHASPRLHWRWGHYTHQRIGKLNSEDFVSVNDLPRTPEGKIDWEHVPTATREAFWKCHELKLIDPILVSAPKEKKNGND